jgi:hypothetical protein
MFVIKINFNNEHFLFNYFLLYFNTIELIFADQLSKIKI